MLVAARTTMRGFRFLRWWFASKYLSRRKLDSPSKADRLVIVGGTHDGERVLSVDGDRPRGRCGSWVAVRIW
jgi:hypothetical protein